ncbi:MAG: radical SAM protein [Candidatus Altiarchaeota archaeon]
MSDDFSVLLASPPYIRLFGLRVYPAMPLGLLYVGSTLREWGINASVYCADKSSSRDVKDACAFPRNMELYRRGGEYVRALNSLRHPAWVEFKEKLAKFSPSVLGISATTQTYPSAVKAAEIAKKLDEDVIVVVGGPHPTLMPSETLAEPCFDVVVRGEGEYTMLDCTEAIREGASLSGVLGVSFKDGGRQVHNPSRPLIDDINLLSYPDRDLLFERERYSPDSFGGIVTSRGCPNKCSYCSCTMQWGNKLRLRTPENVVEEMEHLLEEYGTRNFSFVDDTFNTSKRRVLKICRLIRDKNLSITWRCLIRERNIDANMLSKMRDSGCVYACIGVESGSQRLLNRLGRDADLRKVKKAVNLVKKAGIRLNASYMIGVPGETQSTLTKTEKLMKELETDVNVELFRPFPGTPIWHDLKQKKKIVSTNWADYNMLGTPIFKGSINEDDLLKKYEVLSVR